MPYINYKLCIHDYKKYNGFSTSIKSLIYKNGRLIFIIKKMWMWIKFY